MSESSSTRTRILLAQLPHPSYIDRNVPLAAGYLKASAYRHGLLEEVDIEILGPVLSDYSGCQRLIDTIISMSPDILGFSLYLWNVERTLYNIEKIKAKLPYLKVLVGGPEVTRNSTYILSNPDIDIAVFGEGEITFVEVIRHILHGQPAIDKISGICYRKNDDVVVNRPRKRITDLELIPSPYLLGFIDPREYREMMLFTMRGCMLGCAYCSWTGRGKLRAFAIERLRKELTLAKKTGEEMIVSILDSAFNASPVFLEFCEMAQKINKDKTLKFNCFIQADLVDEETARLLKASNFTGVEVGLQSTDPKVLANVNRSIGLAEFLRGVRILQKEGIPLTVDTILGLPGDSLATFEETMRFVSDNELNPLIFNLSLGHGAKLRRQAKEFGAKVQTAPPFYVLETSTFTRRELETALNRHKEVSADFDKILNVHYPSILSSLHSFDYHIGSYDGFHPQSIDYLIRNIILKIETPPKASPQVNKLAELIGHKVANDLSILWIGNGENLSNSLWLIQVLFTEISRRNPHITWDIHLETKGCDPSQALLEEIVSFIRKPKVYLDYRDELFPQGLPSVRRKSVNIFAHLPCNRGQTELQVNESNCIRTATIVDQEVVQYQVQKLIEASGCGFLIDFPVGSDIGFVRESMGLLYTLGRDVFFKDWVLQRVWEQEYLRITPEKQPHYELVIDQDMNLFGKFFDESELFWDAITKWGMFRSEYSGLDIVKVITDKIASGFSVTEKTAEVSAGG